MSASEILTLKCLHCYETIEAPREALGSIIECCHCGRSTVLQERETNRTDSQAESGFLRICREIWSDGELTSEEVWLMAEWLNDNPGDRTLWPGSVIFPLLKDAFADGVVSEGEMRALAEGLASIETECSRRAKGHAIARRIEIPAQTYVLRTEDIVEVALPDLDYRTRVGSVGEAEYEVDLSEYKCGCVDWVSKRSANQPRTLSRCCKHIVAALMESDEIERLGSIFRAVLNDCDERGRGTHPGDRWFTVQIRGTTGLISLGQGEWSNVFVAEGDGWARYGYHRAEKRWSYGEVPVNGSSFAVAIANLGKR